MAAVVLLVSMLTFGTIVYWNLLGNVSTFELEDNSDPELDTFEGGVNILIVGSDTRVGQGEEFGEGTAEAEGTLNDVNMLFHLSEDHSHASLVSIPRDTIVDTPQCTNDEGQQVSERYGVMMNSILEDGGMGCIVSTVEEMSGLDIQFAAMITFRGVIEMSNAVGGVDVCVEQPIEDSYVGLSLDAGTHSLQGEDALKFLRTRHGVGDGSDLSRITNQQVFLSALFRTVKSNETLTNPTKLYGIARAATQNMTLSSNMNSVDTLVSLATALASVPNEAMGFVRLPVADSTWSPGRVEPTADADVMWQLLQDDQPLIQAADPDAADGGSGATDDSGTTSPDATTPGATDDGSGATDDGTGATDDGTGSTDAPVTTPTFDGQTADQQTCSNTDTLF
jgi:LCP family protein required for cell wall assembly